MTTDSATETVATFHISREILEHLLDLPEKFTVVNIVKSERLEDAFGLVVVITDDELRESVGETKDVALVYKTIDGVVTLAGVNPFSNDL